MSKKVCHLLITSGNKNQKYTADLIENLNKTSGDEHFIYCHRQIAETDKIGVIVSVEQPKRKALLQFLHLYTSDGDYRKLSKKLSKRNIYKWLWLIAYKIDVLHIHHAHAISRDVIEYLRAKGVKIIISLRGRDLLVNTQNVKESKLLKSKLDLADEIHCISHFMKSALFKLFGLNAKVVYRGLHLPQKSEVKLIYQKTDTINIIVAGRLDWDKGHIYLIESIHRLLNKGYLCKVDIYGEGNLQEFLQFRINQLGLEKVIYLKGFLGNTSLRSLYKNYDIAVQPSLTEALSNGLVDFMFHNLPCVVTGAGGMPEIIGHRKNGIVFNKENMLQLDQAILEARDINFEDLIQYNTEIRDKFTSKNEVEGLLRLYG
ncbi:MAG: glycosyltransferase [Aequorivita sp.]